MVERSDTHHRSPADDLVRSSIQGGPGGDPFRAQRQPAIYGMFGFKVGEVTPSHELFCSGVHPDDRERVRAGELRCIETGHNHDEEYRLIWPGGSLHWLRETGNVVKDANGQPIRMMGVVRAIGEEKASVNQLEKMARHDPLTGLPNRLLLEESLTRALARARRNATRMTLVFIDLNGFKQINDRYGHAVGDQAMYAAKRHGNNQYCLGMANPGEPSPTGPTP